MKLILCILFAFISLFGLSQTKRILPPSGNNLLIADVAFNANSDKVISVGFDQKIVIWDIASKKPIKTLNSHTGPIHSVSVNEPGTRFITVSEDSTIKVWDAQKFTLIQSVYFGAPVYHASYDRDNNFWIASSPNGKVRIYDANSNKLHKEYTIECSFLNEAVLSTNSKLFFTGDNNGTFKALGVEDGKAYINHNMETPVKSIRFSPDRSLMILHLGSGRAELLQLPDMKALGALPAPTKKIMDNYDVVSEVDVSSDGRWMISGQDKGHVDIIRLETMIKQAVVSSHPFITKCKFSRDDRYAAVVGTDLNITILDLINYGDTSSRRVPYKLLRQESDIPRWLKFHPDSTIAFSGYYSNHWDLKTGIFTSLPAFNENYEDLTYQFSSIKADDHEIYYDLNSMLFLVKIDTFIFRPFNLLISDNENYLAYMKGDFIYHYDLKNGNRIGKYKNNKRIVCVDNSGKYVVSGDPKGMNLNGKSIELPWDLNDADIHENMLIAGTLENEYWLYDLDKKKVVQRNKVKPGEGATVKFIGNPNKAVIAGYTRELQVVNPMNGEVIFKTKIDNSITDEIAISPDQKIIAINADDRIIRLFRNDESLEKVFEIYTLKDHGAVAVNNDGYYISSNAAHKELAFYFKDKVYPGSYFDLEFNRPDLVLKESPYSEDKTVKFYEEIVLSRKKKTGELFDLNLPFIEFNNKSQYSVRVEDQQLKMTCELPKEFSTDDLAFFNNNVPVKPKVKRKGDELEITYTLIPGKNKLEICPSKNNHYGLKDYYEITYDVKTKPDLYIVSLGVSEFSNKAYNLKYAAKDSKDFYIELAQSKEFNKIHDLLLSNQEVSKEKIQDIKKFLSSAKEEDVVIVFIAGHGVLDDQFNYYYATHNMDFQDPAKNGISFEELEDLLTEVASINKVLFMDTCHSGELEEDEVVQNTEKIEDGDITFRGSNSMSYSSAYQQKANYMSALFSDLRTNNGAVILSSSSGVEFSMEGDKWKNGLFTYCLLKGLRENQGDLDNDGTINISELLSYVTNQVYFLSKGKQRPNLRQSNLSLDLRIK